MKLRYFVGVPEDAFRKHDVVFTGVEAADIHAAERPGLHTCDILFVYAGLSFTKSYFMPGSRPLLLMLDLNDLCERFDRTYKAGRLEISVYPYFEKFAERLLRFRRMAQKLKEAA